jgi:hypothetical protein
LAGHALGLDRPLLEVLDRPADGAHPQGGRQAEPERSEKLALRPAGADTADAASHTHHPARSDDDTHAATDPPLSPELTSTAASQPGQHACPIANALLPVGLVAGLNGECVDDSVGSMRLYR